MSKRIAILIAVLAAVTSGFAAADDGPDKELIQIQAEWAAARMNADIQFLERLYAEEFRITAINGAIIDRNADIAVFASGDLKPESIADEEMKVSVYGDVAVVTGIEKVKGTYKNIAGNFVIRFTNVYVRREGRWQMVTHHGTEVRQPRMEGSTAP